MSPKNYVKIAVNHEVCSKMVKLLISHQVVSLLASQGTCVTGYGPQRTGTFDSCIYTKLQQIMVTQSEKLKRKTMTDFFSQMKVFVHTITNIHMKRDESVVSMFMKIMKKL